MVELVQTVMRVRSTRSVLLLLTGSVVVMVLRVVVVRVAAARGMVMVSAVLSADMLMLVVVLLLMVVLAVEVVAAGGMVSDVVAAALVVKTVMVVVVAVMVVVTSAAVMIVVVGVSAPAAMVVSSVLAAAVVELLVRAKLKTSRHFEQFVERRRARVRGLSQVLEVVGNRQLHELLELHADASKVDGDRQTSILGPILREPFGRRLGEIQGTACESPGHTQHAVLRQGNKRRRNLFREIGRAHV